MKYKHTIFDIKSRMKNNEMLLKDAEEEFRNKETSYYKELVNIQKCCPHKYYDTYSDVDNWECQYCGHRSKLRE